MTRNTVLGRQRIPEAEGEPSAYDDSKAANVVGTGTQLFGVPQHLLCAHRRLWFQFELDYPFIADLLRNHVFSNKVDARDLVPRGRKLLVYRVGFVAIFH